MVRVFGSPVSSGRSFNQAFQDLDSLRRLESCASEPAEILLTHAPLTSSMWTGGCARVAPSRQDGAAATAAEQPEALAPRVRPYPWLLRPYLATLPVSTTSHRHLRERLHHATGRQAVLKTCWPGRPQASGASARAIRPSCWICDLRSPSESARPKRRSNVQWLCSRKGPRFGSDQGAQRAVSTWLEGGGSHK